MLNPAEELFDHFLRPYYPYLSDKRCFEKKNTDQDDGQHRTSRNFHMKYLPAA